tara:strand:- start:62955 stop:63422 length:468 start_codon:yes stop_codon:yes gene_type:complete
MTEKDSSSSKKSGSGCGGCLGGFLLVFVSAVIFMMVTDESDFSLMPGEANMSVSALQQTFDEIDRILPDSLVITDELDPYDHYSQAESFGNIFYGLNPVIMTALRADTSKKYRFQYLARVDHVDANEFIIRDFLVDSIWLYVPVDFSSRNPFQDN